MCRVGASLVTWRFSFAPFRPCYCSTARTSVATYLRSSGSAADEESLVDPFLRRLRVLIAHDWLVTWAGSERCMAVLFELFTSADLVVGVVGASPRDASAVSLR